jgi:hypothetical protein
MKKSIMIQCQKGTYCIVGNIHKEAHNSQLDRHIYLVSTGRGFGVLKVEAGVQNYEPFHSFISALEAHKAYFEASTWITATAKQNGS